MSTCDHICRECGQVMNCQHCHPWQLPKDRLRIVELEAALSAIHSTSRRVTHHHEWYIDGVRQSPGEYVVMRVGNAPNSEESPF